ncbi:MAG: hypothetical protein MR215_07825 [Bacteroidales bacterium]|nr:hypothetical protein [Bacteroidales bacterium]
MNGDTTSLVLDYAEAHKSFGVEELYEYLNQKTEIKRPSVLWHLFKLVNANELIRTGRGMYTKADKPIFSPQPTAEVRHIYDLLRTAFPFAKFCVYQGDVIEPLQHHLSSNSVIYVETEKGSAETVFNYLNESMSDVYLRPGKDFIYRYVDMGSNSVFVKNLVSESPMKKVSDVPMPTIEKLMVDILRDADFFYLQGCESERIIENAFSLYAVNRSRLFRYAGRRKTKGELLSILGHLGLQ